MAGAPALAPAGLAIAGVVLAVVDPEHIARCDEPHLCDGVHCPGSNGHTDEGTICRTSLAVC
jgi:hypothetical protein